MVSPIVEAEDFLRLGLLSLLIGRFGLRIRLRRRVSGGIFELWTLVGESTDSGRLHSASGTLNQGIRAGAGAAALW